MQVRCRGFDLLHDLHSVEQARSDASHMQVRCRGSMLHDLDSVEEARLQAGCIKVS